MNKQEKALLENQQYGLTGNHSAVKICTWTKKSLRDEGVCYKEKFYGIKSHKCCQMTPSLGICQNECIFCWRDQKVKGSFKPLDEPEDIIKNSVIEQRRLLNGFKGNAKVNMEKFEQAQNPDQYAISLSGEPTLYPKLSELIERLHKAGCTTFLVTNGLQPGLLTELAMPTQLYVSLDAPNEELFNKIDKSSVKDAWKKLNETLDLLPLLNKKTRTAIRITLIKGYNLVAPEQYAARIEKSSPMFVEVKGYMFVGSSRQRLSMENMPRHPEVKAFAEKICKHCSYKIVDEQPISRVVLLMKEDKDRFIKP
ncbi:MAG: 4-demethylwyosine synthase TYW1 [archaeon]